MKEEVADIMTTTTTDVAIVMVAIRSRDIKRKTPTRTKEASRTVKVGKKSVETAIKTIAMIETRSKKRRKL